MIETKGKIFFILLFFCILISPFAQDNTQSIHDSGKAELSYAFGMAVAYDLAQTGLEFDYNAFVRGFREVMENRPTDLSIEEAYGIVDAAIYEAMTAQAEINLQIENAFLAENAARPGVHTTPSGLQYEIIVEGYGNRPTTDSVVRVHYEGCLADGTVFDSSYTNGETLDFHLQQVIEGWKEGLTLMREGGTSRLYIPSRLGYGSQGASGIIPPYSVLIFKVELLKIIE